MAECSHNCETCKTKCDSNKESLLVPQNEFSRIKHVYGIVSGKGGVGKSLLTSLLANEVNKRGYKTAILDADITGPSIPKGFGMSGLRVNGNEDGMMLPAETDNHIKVMSINLLMDEETKPVVWRGPVIAGAIKQFWTDVVWGEVDYMFIDMPPGTGDVPLTVFQSFKLDGIIIMTSPQDLVSMIVSKAINMANMMNVPITGIIENMSYFQCPNCNTQHKIFGNSGIDSLAKELNIPILAKIPIDPNLAFAVDQGKIEDLHVSFLDDALTNIIK